MSNQKLAGIEIVSSDDTELDVINMILELLNRIEPEDSLRVLEYVQNRKRKDFYGSQNIAIGQLAAQ